jgi:putative transposase
MASCTAPPACGACAPGAQGNPDRPEAGVATMKAAGQRGRHPRQWKRTTVAGDKPVAAPDLIWRDFTATAAELRWCGDISYATTWDG